MQDSGGNIFTGKVWPGICAFVDYTNPSSQSYWQSEVEDEVLTVNRNRCKSLLSMYPQISKFLQLLPVDGLWMDMNEPSNFCNGECISASDASKPRRDAGRWRSKHVFDPSNPPYAIDNQGDRAALNVKTTDMDVTHYDGQIVYNTHNLFGQLVVLTSTSLTRLSEIPCRIDGVSHNQLRHSKHYQKEKLPYLEVDLSRFRPPHWSLDRFVRCLACFW